MGGCSAGRCGPNRPRRPLSDLRDKLRSDAVILGPVPRIYCRFAVFDVADLAGQTTYEDLRSRILGTGQRMTECKAADGGRLSGAQTSFPPPGNVATSVTRPARS
jgi:hypothetical protein